MWQVTTFRIIMIVIMGAFLYGVLLYMTSWGKSFRLKKSRINRGADPVPFRKNIIIFYLLVLTFLITLAFFITNCDIRGVV